MRFLFASIAIWLCLFAPVAVKDVHAINWKIRYFEAEIPKSKLLRGPYLQSTTNNSTVIRWRTNVLERGIVKYGTAIDKLEFTDESIEISMDHMVTLTDLIPYTKYYYSIGGETHTLEGDSNNYFNTLPKPGAIGLYRIGFFGDVGNSSENQINIRDEFVKYLGDDYMNAWILLGDNAYEFGTDAEYQKNFFDVYQNQFLSKYPLYVTPGNHDYLDIGKYRGKNRTSREVAYFKNFTMPINGEAGGVPSHDPSYFSFDIGNIHLISLDSYFVEESGLRLYDTISNQVQWLKKDLELNKNKEWVVVFWHHPPYSMGGHNSDTEKTMVKLRENLVPIIERYGVDLVLGGHSHSYERSKLMSGHYGLEATFANQYNLSESSGSISTFNGPYIKGRDNRGTVYVVTGSAGKLDSRTQNTWPHKAMPFSNAEIGGAVMLEVQNHQMNLKWICSDGLIRDEFTLIKNMK